MRLFRYAGYLVCELFKGVIYLSASDIFDIIGFMCNFRYCLHVGTSLPTPSICGNQCLIMHRLAYSMLLRGEY